MNAHSSLDTRLCGCKAHGGSKARQIAVEAGRQAFIRRVLNPNDALRGRIVALDALSAMFLAERDQIGVDYAGGAGY